MTQEERIKKFLENSMGIINAAVLINQDRAIINFIVPIERVLVIMNSFGLLDHELAHVTDKRILDTEINIKYDQSDDESIAGISITSKID